MEPIEAGNDEPWYSARCIFRKEMPDHSNLYEERVILLRAENWEQAFRIAEEEAEEYAAEGEGLSYTGCIDIFHLFDSTIGHRTEVFSLARTSDLGESEYIEKYYDTGSECSRRMDGDGDGPSESG